MIRKADKKTTTVAARIPEDMKKRLFKAAKRRKEKPSDTLRKALAVFLLEN